MLSRRSVFKLFASALAFAAAPFHRAKAEWGTEAEIFADATNDIDLDKSITEIADAAAARMRLIGRHPSSFAKYFADPKGWNGEV